MATQPHVYPPRLLCALPVQRTPELLRRPVWLTGSLPFIYIKGFSFWPLVLLCNTQQSDAPKQTARGSTGTRCQRVGGSELVPSLALFKHIYTANAPELPHRTWVCFRYVLPELPGRWLGSHAPSREPFAVALSELTWSPAGLC